MAEKVDLSVEIKESTGDYFPTIYIDFMDISYGRLPDWGQPEETEPSFEYARYSMDPENGTHIDGSISLYFTKEAFEPVEDLSEWIEDNFKKLYVYTFLCPYHSINTKVERGVLSAKELFNAMTPARKQDFTSESPAYEAVMAELKEGFLSNTFFNSSGWRKDYPDYDTDDQGDLSAYIVDGEFTRSFLEAHMNTPGHFVYNRFWGPDSRYGGNKEAAMNGPWKLASDLGITNPRDSTSVEDTVKAGWSFMESYVAMTLYAMGGSGQTSREYNYGTRLNMHRLSDLVYNADGTSNVRVEPMFDEDGDQVAVLANIPIKFSCTSNIYDGDTVTQTGAIESRLGEAKSIYFIGVVGTKVYSDGEMTSLQDDNQHPGDLTASAKKLSSTLFDLNFGDITYQKIFAGTLGNHSELILADQKEEIYVQTSDNVPHPSNPIMSMNGTYHASKPVNHQYVVSQMMQLIKKYAPFTDEERALRQNIANLSSILASDEYTIDILRRLQFFRRSYMDKSPTTKSGKLYQAFKKIIYPINRQVLKQPRLKKIRITNNKIIDSRITAPNLSYTGKTGAGNCESTSLIPGPVGCKGWAQMGNHPDDEPISDKGEIDNIYLPRTWHHMSRRTLYTIPIAGRELMSEFSQYIAEEGQPTLEIGGEILPLDTGHSTGAGSDVIVGSSVMYDDPGSEGDGESGGLANVAYNTSAHLSSFFNGRMSGVSFQNPEGLEYGWSGNYLDSDDEALRASNAVVGDSTNFSQDTVVENRGIFFFDYEKALHSHSKLSFVLPVYSIQRYMGLHVPYEFYRVKKVTMYRRENIFLTSIPEELPAELSPGLDNTVTIKMELTLDNGKTYPFPKKSTYSGFQDSQGGLFYRYGQPTVRVASADLLSSDDVIWDAEMGDIDSYASYTAVDEIQDRITGPNPLMGPGTFDEDATDDYRNGISAMMEAYRGFGHSMTGVVEPNHSEEKKSYISLYSFDAPCGAGGRNRAGGNADGSWGMNDIDFDSDSTPNRPVGQLFNYEGQVVRGGYRLMAFNYADYMDDDVAYYNTVGINEFAERLSTEDKSDDLHDWATEIANHPTYYRVQVEVEDKSLKMIQIVYNIFKNEYDNFISNYYNRAIASCSFNNIDDRFNDFFVKGINETYPDPGDRYWMRAPYMLNLGRQVFFNTFSANEFVTAGDSVDNVAEVFTAMEEEATKLAGLIGPEDGRLIHLQKFKVDFEKFLNIIKPQINSPTTNRSGRRLFGATQGAHPYADRIFDSPVFNYHPIYNRVIDVAGVRPATEETSDDFSTTEIVTSRWNSAINSSHTYVFENVFPIDQPIYGDLFLSNLYSWEYTPPNLKLDFGVMFKWLKNIQYLLDPKQYSHNLSTFDREHELPQMLNGFYNIDSTTDPGIFGRTGGELRGPYIAAPPAWLPNATEDILKGDESTWRGWIDQVITACFLYRFGTAVAAGMGVMYTGAYDSTDAFGFDATTDGFGSGDEYAHAQNEGEAEKVVLADYSMDEIVQYIAEQYALEEGRDDLDSARAELTGISCLLNAYQIWSGTTSSFQSVFGASGRHWTDSFLACIKHLMMPELTTTEVAVSNRETIGMPYYGYHFPMIHYVNVAKVSGIWKRVPIRSAFGSYEGSPWANNKVTVIASRYEFYGGAETAGTHNSCCGWHYIPAYYGALTFGSSSPHWNRARGDDSIHPLIYHHRYPSGFFPPELTGERTGGDTFPEVRSAELSDEELEESLHEDDRAGHPKAGDLTREYVGVDRTPAEASPVTTTVRARVRTGTADGYTDMSDLATPPWER